MSVFLAKRTERPETSTPTERCDKSWKCSKMDEKFREAVEVLEITNNFPATNFPSNAIQWWWWCWKTKAPELSWILFAHRFPMKLPIFEVFSFWSEEKFFTQLLSSHQIQHWRHARCSETLCSAGWCDFESKNFFPRCSYGITSKREGMKNDYHIPRFHSTSTTLTAKKKIEKSRGFSCRKFANTTLVGFNEFCWYSTHIFAPTNSWTCELFKRREKKCQQPSVSASGWLLWAIFHKVKMLRIQNSTNSCVRLHHVSFSFLCGNDDVDGGKKSEKLIYSPLKPSLRPLLRSYSTFFVCSKFHVFLTWPWKWNFLELHKKNNSSSGPKLSLSMKHPSKSQLKCR